MADYSPDPTLVRASSAAKRAAGQQFAGESLEPGEAAYLEPISQRWKKASSTGTSPANEFDGIVETPASENQPVSIITEDSALNIGVDIPAGQTGILSNTPGLMCPDADAQNGWYKHVAFSSLGNHLVNFKRIKSGVAAVIGDDVREG